jgi:hypothetical protein
MTWATVVRWSLKVVVGAVLLVAYLLVLAWWISSPMPESERRVITQPTEVEARWLRERYDHHGIWISITEHGETYFWRDGQKCKL